MKSLARELMCHATRIDISYSDKSVSFFLEERHRPHGPGVVRVTSELMPEAEKAFVFIDDPDRDHFVTYEYRLRDGVYITGTMREYVTPRGASNER